MWIAVAEINQNTFDLLLGLSPEVYFGPEGSALVNLGGVASYWKLATLSTAHQNEHFEHPLLAKLVDLSKKHRLVFTLAPTACLAFWLAKHSKSSLVNIWDYPSFLRRIENVHLQLSQDFISDLLLVSAESRGSFDEFCLGLEDLGIATLSGLLKLEQDGALNARFGIICSRLLKRLRMKSDFDLHEYVPPITLEESFYPSLEEAISSDRNPKIFDRLHEILLVWEERLRARQSLLCGLHLYLRSSRKNKAVSLTLRMPRATRDPRILLKILEEKWHAECGKEDFPDEIEIVRLSSLGLKAESDRQLSLFDPRREEVAESWNLLLARLQTKSTLTKPVRLGGYQAFPSYWPEASMEWVDWKENFTAQVIEDHPLRPQILLREPKTLTSIETEAEFFSYLDSHRALNSLERVRDTWSGNFEERSYARIANQWVYWDHKRRKIFVHGYFEEALCASL